MDGVKFILVGSDKKTLSSIKKLLIEEGNLYVGYAEAKHNALRLIRARQPDLVIINLSSTLQEFANILDIVEEELLCACLLIFDTKLNECLAYLKNTKIINYLIKPFSRDWVIQMAEVSLVNYNRIVDYEKKLKKLNTSIETKRIIDKAKWLLIEQDNITEAEAYEKIKKKSRDNRIPMRNIAEAIILTRSF